MKRQTVQSFGDTEIVQTAQYDPREGWVTITHGGDALCMSRDNWVALCQMAAQEIFNQGLVLAGSIDLAGDTPQRVRVLEGTISETDLVALNKALSDQKPNKIITGSIGDGTPIPRQSYLQLKEAEANYKAEKIARERDTFGS